MKTLILLTTVTAFISFIQPSAAMSMEMHRHLEEEEDVDNKPKPELFQMESKDFVQAKFTIAPLMKVVSPMERFEPHAKQKDDDGNVVENPVDPDDVGEQVINPKQAPCGGFRQGKVHFDAEMGKKIFVAWKVIHPDVAGNCTIRLGSGVNQENFATIYPDDGSANKKGKFECGREQSNYDGKMIKLPKNLTCDECTLQVEWETKATGNLYSCSDMQILNGVLEDCAGQCTNGAVCMNGGCQCRKGYSGKFCEYVEVVVPKTNYTQYLKFLLFFIIVTIVIIGLLLGAWTLFKKAREVQAQQQAIRDAQPKEAIVIPQQIDEDDIGGGGIDPSNRGNRGVAQDDRRLFQV